MMAVRPRVLLLTEACIGGVKTHLLHLLRGLSPARFDLTLGYSTRGDPFVKARLIEEARGTRLVEIPMAREIAPLQDARAFRRIAGLLREGKFDLLHTHASKAGILGRFAARLAGPRAVAHTAHTFAFQWTSNPLYSLLERTAGTFACSRVVAVAEGQRRIAQATLRLPRGRLVCIENGVDEQRFSPLPGPPSHPPVAGSLARLWPQKGAFHFLRAAQRLKERAPGVRLLLGGEGPLRFQILERIDRMGLKGTVDFLGEVEDPARFYSRLQVFVLSSLWEGMPYVILEAMACGLPVVAFRIAGNADLVEDGVTGHLVAPCDEEAMAERVASLLEDEERRREMGRLARERVLERFTLRRFLDRTEALYEELLAGRS